MFVIDEELTISITRGDAGVIGVSATADGEDYEFEKGDVVRLKVFEKKKCENVVLCVDVVVEENTTVVEIPLTSENTTIGDVISKPVDYWYEVELNPGMEQQTIIGYDDNGAKIFKLYPEGGEINE